MSSERFQVRSNRRFRWIAIPVAATIAAVLAGCTPQQLQGYLPGEPGITDHWDRIAGLWTNSWIVLMVVGIVVWGLILWTMVIYRRRKGQTGLPVQLRYNMPIEALYTIAPLVLVLGFFAFTARDQAAIEAPLAEPDVSIEVFGKQWSWDFNYLDENVYVEGEQARQIDEAPYIDYAGLPTLVLPVNKSVEIKLESRDVVHSLWIVEYLYKKDMIPAKSNYMYFTPLKEGDYMGKCAELCGEYHSLMLFNVKVVSDAEYERFISGLEAAGQTGRLGPEYNRNANLPNNEAPAIRNEQGTEE